MSKKAADHTLACPCGSGARYAECCGPYLEGGARAGNAAALMRSRYTAYGLGREPYLLATWHPATRPPVLNLDNDTKWIGLDVLRHEQFADDQAVVEFVARCKINGRAHRLHEVSRFVCESGQWFYVDGKVS